MMCVWITPDTMDGRHLHTMYQKTLLTYCKVLLISSLSNYWSSFFFLNTASNKFAILSSLKGKGNATAYRQQKMVWHLTLPFLHKASGILSNRCSIVPSHATFPFIIASSDFHVLLFLQLLQTPFTPYGYHWMPQWKYLHGGIRYSGVWWFGQTSREIKLIFHLFCFLIDRGFMWQSWCLYVRCTIVLDHKGPWVYLSLEGWKNGIIKASLT